MSTIPWRPEDTGKPVPAKPNSSELFRPDILEFIDQTIKQLSQELRTLSLDIHSHPELRYEEYHAHDVLTTFMDRHGFRVERKFHLDTAWRATFSHGTGGRTIGINSEMDALEGIGHACGHNLIAISGVAVACALKAAFIKFNLSGKISILGTPAEEGGAGKVALLEKGAYDDMDVCLMCHPAPGPKGSVSLSGSLALQRIIVEYHGHTAHAGLSPWEGKNGLDAAVLAYNNISMLRQQIRPTHRIHGIIEGKDWVANIIPNYSKMIYYVRAPTVAEVKETAKRVTACFEAAATATGCELKLQPQKVLMGDLRQNKALGKEVANIILNKYGDIDYEWGIKSASTDFGNITYALPSLHPGFAIPTVVDGGNHTPGFRDAAATPVAHDACLDVSIALAGTGIRVLLDDNFFAQVKKTFEDDKASRSAV
ncbi:hypothetical protein AMATHDRAFT_59581 [Amanita thiersii Skay4041]|uniref:Peptidase M20 domain-containing protein 2 n=1 Tax=Amanita thiersii Skay4041 TaxID=703135 RepID=A0A2A9NTM3_9AGAR|nr:hypothetical protein AMATHDRAFT_59581 [Amanita thiersii Skay4041]